MNDQGKITDEFGDAGVLLSLDLPLERTESNRVFDDLVVIREVSSIWDAPKQGGGIVVPTSTLATIEVGSLFCKLTHPPLP